jgi:hypothetical protein
MKREKKIELVVLFVYFIVMFLLAWFLRINFLTISITYFGIPAFHYLFKCKNINRKTFLQTILLTASATLIVETIAHSSKSWFVPSIFPFRIYNIFPLESYIWCITYCLFMIVFYEYFFDKGKVLTKISTSMKWLLRVTWGIVVIVGLIAIFFPTILSIPYFYAIFIALFTILNIVVLSKRPSLYRKMSLLSLFLFIPSVLHELVSLELGHWSFTKGYHVGYVDLFGYVFPFEELIWFLIVPVTILVVYELFMDDGK